MSRERRGIESRKSAKKGEGEELTTEDAEGTEGEKNQELVLMAGRLAYRAA